MIKIKKQKVKNQQFKSTLLGIFVLLMLLVPNYMKLISNSLELHIILIISFILIILFFLTSKVTRYFSNKATVLVPEFNQTYFRDIQEELRPGIVYMLMGGNKMRGTNTTPLIATLLDLIKREYLIVENISSEKVVLKFLKNEDFILHINKEKNLEDLLLHEKNLVDWFISKLGDGNSLRISELKSKLANDNLSGCKLEAWYNLLKVEYQNARVV